MHKKPKFKKGQRVRWARKTLTIPRHWIRGTGRIAKVYAAYGPVPTNYWVEGFPRGVLFEDELKRA